MDDEVIFKNERSPMNAPDIFFRRRSARRGIAVIWIFKTDRAGAFAIPRDLLIPGVLIVAGLGLDLLQYCVATITWRVFYRRQEKADVDEDAELEHSIYWEVPIVVLFWLKLVCVFVAYVLILRYLVRALSFT
jgi:hypothetical protein